MFIEDFIEAAKTYADLGWAIQEQLDDLLDPYQEFDAGELNENAVNNIESFANNLPGYIDTTPLLDAIDRYRVIVENEESYV